MSSSPFSYSQAGFIDDHPKAGGIAGSSSYNNSPTDDSTPKLSFTPPLLSSNVMGPRSSFTSGSGGFTGAVPNDITNSIPTPQVYFQKPISRKTTHLPLGKARRSLKFSHPSPQNSLPPPPPFQTLILFNPATYDQTRIIEKIDQSKQMIVVIELTILLLDLFKSCRPTTFYYDKSLNPRRVLTKPSKPVHNHGWDNEKHDYILYVNDVIGDTIEGSGKFGKHRYVILDLLGQGTFGQVVKCQRIKAAATTMTATTSTNSRPASPTSYNTCNTEMVAIKVIKNQPAFLNQSMMEITVLEQLNNKYDPENKRHIIRMKDTFMFRGHLCIVVELLSLNLYDLIKQNGYRGFSLGLCRIFLAQILDAMKVLREAKVIHCDLKPENILLKSLDTPSLKVIDFGSACHEHQTLYTYIQSRFYRSPEVLLGLPYSSAIDMWSLGCIAAELFLGLPIFPGASNYDQVQRITSMIGLPPRYMLEVGKETSTYFATTGTTTGGNQQHRLKTREQYSLETGRQESPPKQYFTSSSLEDIILQYPIRPKDLSEKEREQEIGHRRVFLDFLLKLLVQNPQERPSPYQASQHPFITGKSAAAAAAVGDGAGVKGKITAAVAAKASTSPRPRSNTLSSLSIPSSLGTYSDCAYEASGTNGNGSTIKTVTRRRKPVAMGERQAPPAPLAATSTKEPSLVLPFGGTSITGLSTLNSIYNNHNHNNSSSMSTSSMSSLSSFKGGAGRRPSQAASLLTSPTLSSSLLASSSLGSSYGQQQPYSLVNTTNTMLRRGSQPIFPSTASTVVEDEVVFYGPNSSTTITTNTATTTPRTRRSSMTTEDVGIDSGGGGLGIGGTTSPTTSMNPRGGRRSSHTPKE